MTSECHHEVDLRKMSPQTIDGLKLNLGQTFMFPSGGVLLTFSFIYFIKCHHQVKIPIFPIAHFGL